MPKSAVLIKKLQDGLADLPRGDLEAVLKFVEFLRSSSALKRKTAYMKQDWAGALSEFADEYTSLSLQKMSAHWREG